MLPMMQLPKLAGLAEIAAIAGVSKRTATRYTAREDFPAPIAVLAMGPVWRIDQVQAWLDSGNRPTPGRPPARPNPKHAP